MIKVIQAANTSSYDKIDECSCIEFWRNNNSGRDSVTCRATDEQGTQTDPIVGGHVIAIFNNTPHVYIVPILNSVNVSDYPLTFDVDESDLVQVPFHDEQIILNDPQNRIRKIMLNARRMKDLMK